MSIGIIVSDSSSVGNLWSKVIKQDSIFNGKIASTPGILNDNVPQHKTAEAVAICYHALLGGYNDSDSDDSDTDSEFEGENCKVKNWKVNTEVMKDSFMDQMGDFTEEMIDKCLSPYDIKSFAYRLV